eukprot:s2046_g3.t1
MQTSVAPLTFPRPPTRRWLRPRSHIAEALDVPTGRRDESQGFCFNPGATAFHPDIPLLGTQSEFVQELHAHWEATAFAWEEEMRMAKVVTYFVNHHHYQLRCDHGRIVPLYENYATCKASLRQAWNDQIVPQLSLDFYVVTPQPFQLEPGIAAYVILVQGEQGHMVTSLLSLLDGQGHLRGRSAVTTPDQIYGPHLIAALGCFRLVNSVLWPQCSFQLSHLAPRTTTASRTQDHGTLWLQFYCSVPASMAHNRRPDTPVLNCPDEVDSTPLTLHLDALLPPSDTSSPGTMAFRLIAGADMGPFPSYVECSPPGDEEALSLELCAWGHHCDVFRFGDRHLALCVPHGWYGGTGSSHYMFCHTDLEDEHGAFLHTADRRLTEIELMQLLYQCGYWRASILAITDLDQCLLRVDFANVVVQLPTKTLPVRETPAWPTRATCPKDTDPFFVAPTTIADEDCLIRLGLTVKDLTEFFCSAADVLCRDPTGHGFPDHILDNLIISDSTDLKDSDRILIYTDGSSHAAHRHKPPLWNAEQGFQDTWAFVVVGERYDTLPPTSVIGWIAHPVHYEEDSQYFLGADQISSYIAEREALTWAGLWRLAHNTKIDTIFRTDSLSSAQQARGDSGCAESGTSFTCFRGVFQALESALSDTALQVEHIHGHSNELYNDLADFLAKKEREKSFYCRRQRLSMPLLRPFLPHFWMCFSRHDGLPLLSANGFTAPPPCLPDVMPDEQGQQMQEMSSSSCTFSISLCTANVNSMYTGIFGHAGKTDYLRQQMRSLRLHFLAIQEARTPEFFGKKDGVLRIGTGSVKGLYGLELWVNLEVAYGTLDAKSLYFCSSHFQVLHKDPQCLLVRCETPHISFLLLIGHAPHCGLDVAAREAWWLQFSTLAESRHANERLFVLLDANADPGPLDETHVLCPGMKTTADTPLFRDFLQKHALCLPATSAVHTGPRDTWYSPSGVDSHCIDHVAIPLHCLPDCTFSGVLHDFELGNGAYDHMATAIQLDWKEVIQTSITDPHSARHRQRGYAKDRLCGHHVRTVVQHYDPGPWNVDIESHVDAFNQNLLDGLTRVCPRQKQAAKKEFITDDIWMLRQQKLASRKSLKELRVRQRAELLRMCFAALRSRSAAPCFDFEEFWRYDSWMLCCRVRTFCAFHCSARTLRTRLQRAKHEHLQQVFDQLPENASSATILHALRGVIGPTNLKKVKTATLPMIRDETDNICTTPNEAREVWIRFFQAMEGGVRLTPGEHRSQWIDNLRRHQCHVLGLEVQDLPSLTDLENAFRRVHPGKATGPDDVDALICHADPAIMARKT